MGSRTGENRPDDPLHAYWKVCDELKVEAAAKWEARRATQKAEDELAGERAARVRAEEALRQVADAFTRWSEDANDGTYALYRADDRLTYWKDDDLMAACLNARKVLAAVPEESKP